MSKARGCWTWTGSTGLGGYGQIRDANDGYRTVLAHRFSYSTFVGDIPPGVQVLHECDNPSCVNPAHLFLGTISDNMKDMLTKGRGRWAKHAKRATSRSHSTP